MKTVISRERQAALACLLPGGVALLRVSRTLKRRRSLWSVVWRGRPHRGDSLWIPESPRSQGPGGEQEIAALRHQAPCMEAASGVAVPELLDVDVASGALALGVVGTHDYLGAKLEPAGHGAVYEAAGRAAAALGELVAEGVMLLDVLQPRAQRYLALAEDCFGPRAYEVLTKRVGDTTCLRGQPAPYVHGDASPRNWRVAGMGGEELAVGWIDWERSRPGCTMDDYIWLPFRFAVDRPDLLAAFSRGYGRPFSDREHDQMAWLAAMNLAGAIPWALARGETTYVAELAAMAPRILDGLPWDA
ncbi:MAG: hypothetical protein H6806_03725 [Planctomycetes bacterium]|nr:hypothetical protein [Planctomycetota bacterium]